MPPVPNDFFQLPDVFNKFLKEWITAAASFGQLEFM